MADTRRLSLSITLFVTADLTTEGDSTNVGLVSVNNSIMGGVSPIGGEPMPETTEKWREAITRSATKLGLKHMLNELEGAHEEAPPTFNQPGADA